MWRLAAVVLKGNSEPYLVIAAATLAAASEFDDNTHLSDRWQTNNVSKADSSSTQQQVEASNAANDLN